MTPRETFAYHMTKALKALSGCDIGFVCQESRRAKALLDRAKAERAATLSSEGMREVDMIHEGAPQTILSQARSILGAERVPFKMDCLGARIGDRCGHILDEMHRPGDSFKVPIPKGLTAQSFGANLRMRAYNKGIRLSIKTHGMPEGVIQLTCADHAGHRQQQRLAAQSA